MMLQTMLQTLLDQLFGPKLIRMVGEQITKLNPLRVYCVALSAAITVPAAAIISATFFLVLSSLSG